MATYVPAKRAVEYIFYVGLVSQADAKLLKGSATLAAGDVTVSKDGGAFANLTTLPAVTPAAGKAIKVTLSATEMTADNVTVVFSDAAGAEWCDLIINIPTAARQIDDLATPTNITAGTITTTTNLTNLPAITANWLTAAGIAATALNGKGDWNIGKTGYALSAAGVQAIWDAATTALTVVGSIGKLLVDNINATISSRLATAGYTAPLDAAGTRAAVGLAAADLDTQISSRATPAQVNAEVVDALAVDTYAEPGQGAPAATTTLAVKINYLYKFLRNKKNQSASTFDLFNDAGTVVDQKAALSDDGTTFASAKIISGP